MKKGLISNFYFKFSLLFVLLGFAVLLKPKGESNGERTIKNLNILQNTTDQDQEKYDPDMYAQKIKKS